MPVLVALVLTVALVGATVAMHHAQLCGLGSLALHRLPEPDEPTAEVQRLAVMVQQAKLEAHGGRLMQMGATAVGLVVYEVAADGSIIISRGTAALEAQGLTGDGLTGTNLFRDWSEGPGDRALAAVRAVFVDHQPRQWLAWSSFTREWWWGYAEPQLRAGSPVVRVVAHPITGLVLEEVRHDGAAGSV